MYSAPVMTVSSHESHLSAIVAMVLTVESFRPATVPLYCNKPKPVPPATLPAWLMAILIFRAMICEKSALGPGDLSGGALLTGFFHGLPFKRLMQVTGPAFWS